MKQFMNMSSYCRAYEELKRKAKLSDDRRPKKTRGDQYVFNSPQSRNIRDLVTDISIIRVIPFIDCITFSL